MYTKITKQINEYLPTANNQKYANFVKQDFWMDFYNLCSDKGLDMTWKPRRLYWHFKNEVWNIPECAICGEDAKWNDNDSFYRETCCHSCANKLSGERAYEKLVELHGGAGRTKAAVDKARCTSIKRHGGVGAASKAIADKIKATCLERYGVENARQIYDTEGKIRATNRKKYGADYPNQVAENFETSKRWKRKEYVFESGNVVLVQGYEPFALDELVKQGYTEDDLETSPTNMPRFWYTEGSDKRKYYPDILIKSENRIIEVKSNYTVKCDIAKNKLKRQSVLDKGYKYEVWVFNKKGERLK